MLSSLAQVANRRSRLFDLALIFLVSPIALISMAEYVYVRWSDGSVRAPRRYQEIDWGSPFRVEGVQYRKPLTAIFVLDPTDAYSLAALPAYRSIVQQCRIGGLDVILIMPRNDMGKLAAEQLGAAKSEVHILASSEVGVTDAPALILVNAAGILTDLWMGGMTVFEEQAALRRISLVSSGQELVPIGSAAPGIVTADLKQKATPWKLVDVREREDFHVQSTTGAINIPAEELSPRVRYEIGQELPVAIDCTYTRTGVCEFAARTFRERGFAMVTIMNRGAYKPSSCKDEPHH